MVLPVDLKFIYNVVKDMFKLLKNVGAKEKCSEMKATMLLNTHLKEVINWSKKIQFYGMASGKNTDESTVSLSFDTVPRKFRHESVKSIKLSEKALLAEDDHLIITGDPGAGKTTTLMRLARFILVEDSSSKKDIWQYPLVFRLRELPDDPSLEECIADAIGIRYNDMMIKVDTDKKQSKTTIEKRENVIKYVGSKPLVDFIADFLDLTKGILFLDGLDEVANEYREKLERQIVLLGRKLEYSKIIVTCRSGDYHTLLEGFRNIEICPLDSNQIQKIASKWIKKNSKQFVTELQSLPFADLANRPLFLCQLITFFRDAGYLPDQPSTVYKRIIRLCIEDWDRQRRVKRLSKYSRFDPEQKLEFLSSLSYHLTYKIQSIRFRHEDLVLVYEWICDSFQLPHKESAKVATELESHTGIIVESGRDYYEFSHLSLQEYLCAYYLVREPFSDLFYQYLQKRPAPIAIAVSLSSNPSIWFASIVLKKWPGNTYFQSWAIVSTLSRIRLERPQFQVSTYLGIALLKLMMSFGKEIEENISDMLMDSKIYNSVKNALDNYTLELDYEKPGYYRLKQTRQIDNEYGFIIPSGGNLLNEYYQMIQS
jgi:predicted NACHT family NTPase